MLKTIHLQFKIQSVHSLPTKRISSTCSSDSTLFICNDFRKVIYYGVGILDHSFDPGMSIYFQTMYSIIWRPTVGIYIGTEYMRERWKVLSLAFNRCETRDKRPLGVIRTGVSVTATLMDIDGSIRVCCHSHPWIHGLRPRKLYTIMAVTPAPVRVPTQGPFVPSFTSVVG